MPGAKRKSKAPRGESMARYKKAFESAAIGMALIAMDGRLMEVNPALCALLGYEAGELAALTVNEITHADDLDSDMAEARRLRAGDIPSYQIEKRCVRKDQGLLRCLMSVSLARDEEGAPLYFVAQLQDITQRKLMEEALRDSNIHLRRLTNLDSLTELRNHRAFQERLAEEVTRAQRHSAPLSLLMLDIDHFKAYNDTFGHPAGDEALRAVARLLELSARASDMVARYGGEEFGVILPQTDAGGAMVLAERFRRAIEEAAWLRRPITVSIGCATLTTNLADRAALIYGADSALYHAKSTGRNRVVHVQEIPS